jgi:thymidylate synthase
MDTASEWPVEYADQLIVGSAHSDVGVCCLWSNRNKIAQQLHGAEYAVIGNLYSRAGINALLRNIFANPTIRFVVVTGRSLNDSFEALFDFFTLGVDASGRIQQNGGRIDPVFPHDSLEELRHAVTLVDLRSAARFPDAYRQFLRSRELRGAFAPSHIYPHTPYTEENFPSEENGFTVRGRSIMQTWTEVLSIVMRFGIVTPTDYGTQQRELLNVVSIIHNPSSPLKHIPEWAEFNAAQAEAYVARFLNSEKDSAAAYSYGNRLRSYFGIDQVEGLAAELERSECSRRAVASLWDPVVDSVSTSPPCIATLQASIRDKRVHLSCFVRSHDIFRAYPLNAAAMADLQRRLVCRIGGVTVGRLAFVSQSAHIYSDCWSAAALCQKRPQSRYQFEQDLRGSIVLRTDGTQLIADHFSAQGDLLQTISVNSAKDLLRALSPFLSRVDHALYIGREVTRLETARDTGEPYRQDRTD